MGDAGWLMPLLLLVLLPLLGAGISIQTQTMRENLNDCHSCETPFCLLPLASSPGENHHSCRSPPSPAPTPPGHPHVPLAAHPVVVSVPSILFANLSRDTRQIKNSVSVRLLLLPERQANPSRTIAQSLAIGYRKVLSRVSRVSELSLSLARITME